MFSSKCDFVRGVTKLSDLPPEMLPEFAFIGRSNVGKSSLINSLLNKKSLARVSQNPGMTKQMNFFQVADKIYIVDLPGYGYAKVSKHERVKWGKLVSGYFENRNTLARVFVLVDARRGIGDLDIEIMDFLDSIGISHQVVLTKLDKIKKQEKEELYNQTLKACSVYHHHPDDIIYTSTKSGAGLNEIRKSILQISRS